MTDGSREGREIGSDDFEEALASIVRDAVLAGISVEGGWDVPRRDGELPDYTVEIYQVDRAAGDDD